MAGRRRLSAGMPRLLGNHAGHLGRVYRREWAMLAETFDLSGALARRLAGLVCVGSVALDASTQALVAAQRARTQGRGRRPSVTELARLQKRHGLDTDSYAAALGQLQAYTPAVARPPNPLAAVRQAVAAANRA